MDTRLTPTEELVDITTLSIDQDLSPEERRLDFVRQIKNPNHFRCGQFTIRASYANDGPTLEECLQAMMG